MSFKKLNWFYKVFLVIISFLLIGLAVFSPFLAKAAPSQNNDAGSWTDTFTDENGLSSSTDTGVSGGEVILDSTTPGAWTETSESEFSNGTVSQTDIQTTSGSVLLESNNYTESLGANGFSAVGAAKSWQGDDRVYEYSLPFSFSYYGTNYSTVWVSTNGYIHLDSNYSDPVSTRDKLKSNKIIAPLWMDLVTNGLAQSGEDIYIQENADNVIIYWKGETYLDQKPVNFSLQLYSSGIMKFHYGTGTGLESAGNYQKEIGLSKGDELSYVVSDLDAESSLSNAQTATFSYTSGYLTPGTFTSQTFDGYDNTNNKTAVSIELVTAALPASTSVQVEYSVNGGGGYFTAGTYSTTSGTGTTFTGLSGSGTSLRYRLTLTGTSSVTPEVQSITYNYTLSSSLVETASEDFIDGTFSNVSAGLTQDQVELAKTTLAESLTDREDIATGSAQSLKADDENLLYNLPFPFSFYGTDYDSVYINSNGYLVFGEDYNDFAGTLTNLKAHKIIAPLWTDLHTTGSTQPGEDVYIQENANSVEIYWKAEFWTISGTANFSVELFDNGKIEFHYGTGNTGLSSVTHIVGVSKGDNVSYIESDLSDDSSLELAQTSTIDYISAWEISGTWTSPTYDAGLANQDKLFTSLTWSKTAPLGTLISLEYDLDAAGNWIEDTSGSINFPANTTAKSIRYKVNFTSDGTDTPTLEDITLTYKSYESSGTAVTVDIDPTVGPVEWESVSFNKTTSSSTTLTVDVLDTGNNVLLSNVSSGDSLTSINVNTYTALRLRANLSTTNQGLTSFLQDWTVNWDPRTPTVTDSTDFGSFSGGGNLSIGWTASDVDTGTAGLKASPIDIFYSDDGGTNYCQIVNDLANSSPYSWDTTKVADDTDYKIKITAEDGYEILGSETSPPGTFSLENYSGSNPTAPSVSISAPSSGVTWAGSQSITYSASDPDSFPADLKTNPINIFYSTDNTNWYLIVADQTNSGSYSWDTSTVDDGTSYKVKVRAFDGEGKVGEATSETFSIDNSGPTFTFEYYSDSNLTTALPTSSGVAQAKAGATYLKITASESLQSTPTFGVDQPGSEDVSNQSTTLVSGNIYKGSYTVNTATGGTYIDGTATVSVSGTDEASNNGTGITSGGTFDIDTSVPGQPTISSPTNNQVFLSTTSSISVSGIAEASSTVTVTVGSTEYTTTASGDTGDGTYSRGLIVLSGGTETISVKATDGAANDSSSASISVKQNRKPSISISSPTSSSVFSGSSNTVSWSGSDADSDSLTYKLEYSSNGGSTWTTLVSSQAGTSYTWNVSSLSDGSNYKVKVTADDGTETKSATSASFAIYSTKPTITLSDIGTTNDTTPTFTGTATSTATTIETVKYRVGTSGNWSIATATDGAFGESSEGFSFTLSTLSAGNYTVYVKTRDANQYYSDTASDSFTIETTAPNTPSISSPKDGDILDPSDDTNTSLSGTQIKVTGTAEALATVKLYLNDDYLESTTADSDEDFDFSDLTLVLGTNKITVSAVDAAGNTSGSATATVTYVLDKDAPLVTLSPFVQNPTNNNTPLLVGTVKETLSSVVSLEYSFDGGLTWFASGFSWGDKKEFSFSFESKELEDGDFIFQVRAKDEKDNIGYSEKQSLTIDTTAPFIGGSLITWESQYLLPNEQGVIEVPMGAKIDFIVSLWGEDMVSSQLKIGNQILDLSFSSLTGLWQASFIISEEESDLIVSVADELGNVSERLIATLVANPGGYVFGASTKAKIEGALVRLYFFEETNQEWVIWDGAAYNQQNPVLTNQEGSYSFLVPPGKYYLTVEREGYALFKSKVILVEKNKLISLNVPLSEVSFLSKVEEIVPPEAVLGAGVLSLLFLVKIGVRRFLWLT